MTPDGGRELGPWGPGIFNPEKLKARLGLHGARAAELLDTKNAGLCFLSFPFIKTPPPAHVLANTTFLFIKPTLTSYSSFSS